MRRPTFLITILAITALFLLIPPIYSEDNSIDIERAEELIDNGNYYGLISYSSEILESNPNNVEALFYRGVGFWGIEQYSTSIEYLDKAIELDVSYAEAYYYKSRVYYEEENDKEALLAIKEAIAINSQENRYFTREGKILFQLGEYEKAINSFDRALEIKLTSKTPLEWKLDSLNELGLLHIDSKEYDKADQYFDKILKIDPEFHYAWNNKGIVAYDLGNNELAIEFYDKALEIDPNDELVKENKKLAQNIEEDSIYDIIRPFVLFAVVVLVTYGLYRVQKNRGRHIVNIKQKITQPSFSVLKIRWMGSNFTYQLIFDTERMVFIRPDKIPKDLVSFSLDEMLRGDKMNFEIPFSEINKIEFKDSTIGIHSTRAGKMIIDSQRYRGSFDVLESEFLPDCINLTQKFLPDKVS